MTISKGLIIDAPPIDRILSGEKTWEMRSTSTRQRGLIALIRKGSGTVVGIAELVDSQGPLSRADMLASIGLHRIEPSRIDSGAVDKWNHAWVLRNVRRLARPVPYVHPPGRRDLGDAGSGCRKATGRAVGGTARLQPLSTHAPVPVEC